MQPYDPEFQDICAVLVRVSELSWAAPTVSIDEIGSRMITSLLFNIDSTSTSAAEGGSIGCLEFTSKFQPDVTINLELHRQSAQPSAEGELMIAEDIGLITSDEIEGFWEAIVIRLVSDRTEIGMACAFDCARAIRAKLGDMISILVTELTSAPTFFEPSTGWIDPHHGPVRSLLS